MLSTFEVCAACEAYLPRIYMCELVAMLMMMLSFPYVRLEMGLGLGLMRLGLIAFLKMLSYPATAIEQDSLRRCSRRTHRSRIVVFCGRIFVASGNKCNNPTSLRLTSLFFVEAGGGSL